MGIEIAEAQYRQALSAYWPRAGALSALTRLDDDPLFIFPEETSVYDISGVLPQTISPTVTVPEKRVKLMDKLHFLGAVNLTVPLYTGGLRGGFVKQAKAGIEAAQQVARRTDLQVIYDIKRVYYGAVLAQALTELAQVTLARLEVTLELTKNLYQKGSGRVKKTDYLQNKVIVESVRAMTAALAGNVRLAKSALTFYMGLNWETQIELSERDIPYVPDEGDLKALVSDAYRFNPDWGRLQAGLDAMAGKVKVARSGHLPKLALLGNLQYIGNEYDAGIVGPEEKKSWRVGIGMELPLFNGFLTQNQVREARARLDQLEEQEILFREGLALQVKAVFLQLIQIQGQEQGFGAARKAAEENHRLTARAHQADLVETQDLIEAQLLEALVKAQHEKVRYDHLEARARLALIVGNELEKRLMDEK